MLGTCVAATLSQGDISQSSQCVPASRPLTRQVEMAVPYADPNEPFTRKCAFDVGGKFTWHDPLSCSARCMLAR